MKSLAGRSRPRCIAADWTRLNAKPASVKFFLEKDSIIHPGLSFVYQVEKKTVTLLRTDDGLEKSPYFNTYHKVDMYFEQLTWKIDEPKIEFNFLPNNTQGEAFFESQDFFSRSRLEAIKGQETVSPVQKMNDYYLKEYRRPGIKCPYS